MKLSFTVNAKQVEASAPPVERLSDVLRQELGLFGTKVGCNAGDCGACTILMDGEPVCSCLVAAAQADGCDLVTVEGLTDNETLSRLQESFLHFGAAQCGICTPGMLMSAKALLDRKPNPSLDEVESALGGVLCRCTGYRKIIDAVLHAADFDGEDIAPQAGSNVGSSIRHLDGRPKVTGDLSYAADAVPEDALALRIVRSPHHHAGFTLGDKESYIARHDGVVAVFDAGDIPGRNCFGVIPKFADQPVFAENVARYKGEAIAAVVGEPNAIRYLDDAAFPVTWEVLDAVLLVDEALQPDAPCLHEGRPGNVMVRGRVEHGDAAAAIEASAHRVSVSTSTPFIEHAYIEPEAGYAYRDGDRVVVHGCTQAPVMDRDSVAEIMALDSSAVRVIPSACGGGFGAKLDISFQPYIALAAWKLNRAVTVAYSRGESMMATTKRHPSAIELSVGCDADGKITGFDFDGVFNTGAYASWGPTVADRVPIHASGPYFIPNYRATSAAIHTHTSPAGAFRGFGVPQAAIAQECAFDDLADKAGIDRLQFRLMNALDNGMRTSTGQVFEKGVGIKACLEALGPAWSAATKRSREFNAKSNGSSLRRGHGIASCWYGCGNTSLPNPSTIRMGITSDGKVFLHQGAMDIGQGSNTVISQIAADAFGVPVHSIELIGCDTDLTPDCGKTSASRQTFVTGSAAKLAGTELRKMVLRKSNAGEDAVISLGEGVLTLHDGTSTVQVDLAALDCNQHGYVFMAEETYNPPTSPLDENGQGIPYAVFGYGAQIVELTVDTGLGTVKIDRITTAHDVGRAINPLLVEGQIEGGAAQGIGLALMEDFHPGRTENLHDYLIPTIGDVPEFENIIIEVEDAEGPYGAKGLGEHVLIPTAPAILNSIRNATGAVVRDLPATPDKVMAALKLNDRGQYND